MDSDETEEAQIIPRLTLLGYDSPVLLKYAINRRDKQMTTTKQKLTLDHPTTYQIKLPGILEYRWSDWNRNINVQIENDQESQTG